MIHVTLTLEEAAVLVNGSSFATAAAARNEGLAMRLFPNVVEALNRLGLEGFKALQAKLSEAGKVFSSEVRIQWAPLHSPGVEPTENFGMQKPNDLVA